MKKIKKTIGALAVSLSLLSTVVMAEVPKNSVILGEKGFSLEYASDVKNMAEIVQAVKEAEGKIFIKLANGIWFNNQGNTVEKDVIPEVEYKDKEGNIKHYKGKDGDEYTPGEEKKEEGNTTESGNSGGSSGGGVTIPEEIEAPRIDSAQLIISDGSTLNISISERSSGVIIGNVDVTSIEDNRITGVRMTLDQENCILSVLGNKQKFNDKEVKILAEDEWIKKYDNGLPGVGLIGLKKDKEDIEGEIIVEQKMHIENEEGKSRTVYLKLKVQ